MRLTGQLKTGVGIALKTGVGVAHKGHLWWLYLALSGALHRVAITVSAGVTTVSYKAFERPKVCFTKSGKHPLHRRSRRVHRGRGKNSHLQLEGYRLDLTSI